VKKNFILVWELRKQSFGTRDRFVFYTWPSKNGFLQSFRAMVSNCCFSVNSWRIGLKLKLDVPLYVSFVPATYNNNTLWVYFNLAVFGFLSSVATARLITALDGSTSGAVVFLQSWKEIEGENYVAPTTCVCTLHTTIFWGFICFALI
jgi:hypothetical protein